jgi:hypothetical protein
MNKNAQNILSLPENMEFNLQTWVINMKNTALEWDRM